MTAPDTSGSVRHSTTTRGDDLVIRLEMPGMDPREDVEVTVEEGTVRLKGRGRQAETFEESLTLPAGVKADDIQTTYGEDVLEVVIPGGAAGSKRSVRIHSSGRTQRGRADT